MMRNGGVGLACTVHDVTGNNMCVEDDYLHDHTRFELIVCEIDRAMAYVSANMD